MVARVQVALGLSDIWELPFHGCADWLFHLGNPMLEDSLSHPGGPRGAAGGPLCLLRSLDEGRIQGHTAPTWGAIRLIL